MSCSAKVRNVFAVVGAIFVYIRLFFVKLTAGNLNPYIKHSLDMTDGQTVWVHAVIVSCQALAAIVGTTAAKKIGVLPVTIIGCLLSR